MQKYWYVYMMTNYQNTVLYIGMTNNIKRRKWEHKTNTVNTWFSCRYRLYKLVWFEEFNSPKDAIETEKRIKKWRRAKKDNLIKSVNPNYQDLEV